MAWWCGDVLWSELFRVETDRMAGTAGGDEGWPADLQVSVDDNPHSLLVLLWIREAYDLSPGGGHTSPTLLDTPSRQDVPLLAPADRQRWERAWPQIWRAAVSHAGSEVDPVLYEKAKRTPVGSPEREALTAAVFGPRWGDVFGHEHLSSSSWTEWSRRQYAAHVEARRAEVRDNPEWRHRLTLVTAWRAGLAKVVVIPCSGDYTRRLGHNTLLVTHDTRRDDDKYHRALQLFRSL